MRTVDILIVYRIIKILVTPWEKQPAYFLGIIDSNGAVLKKSKYLKTKEEKDAYSILYRFVFNLKRLLAMVPGGKSRLGTFAAAALLLLKEEDETQLDVDVLFEMQCAEEIIDEDGGVGGIGGGGMSMGGAPVSTGVAPANHTGPSIALTWPNKKKIKKFIP